MPPAGEGEPCRKNCRQHLPKLTAAHCSGKREVRATSRARVGSERGDERGVGKGGTESFGGGCKVVRFEARWSCHPFSVKTGTQRAAGLGTPLPLTAAWRTWEDRIVAVFHQKWREYCSFVPSYPFHFSSNGRFMDKSLCTTRMYQQYLCREWLDLLREKRKGRHRACSPKLFAIHGKLNAVRTGRASVSPNLLQPRSWRVSRCCLVHSLIGWFVLIVSTSLPHPSSPRTNFPLSIFP